MQNVSTIRLIVRRASQKKTQGGRISTPPARARVNPRTDGGVWISTPGFFRRSRENRGAQRREICYDYSFILFTLMSHRLCKIHPTHSSACIAKILSECRIDPRPLLGRGLKSRDLRYTFDRELIRSPYAYFDAYQREGIDGTVIFTLA